MNNSINNNSLKDSKSDILDWNLVQAEMKNKLGLDIYKSWLKKITFVEEINNYILLSVPTRFIRDWITSRYLDQILKIIKNYKKEIILQLLFGLEGANATNTRDACRVLS